MAIVTPAAPSPAGRRRLALASPATGEAIGAIEVAGDDDVRAAVLRARKAQEEWGQRPPAARADVLRRALRVLLARQDDFVDVIVRESGKPRSEALMMEIFAGCDCLHYHARRAPRLLAPERRRLHGLLALTKRLRIFYRPLGVVGVISPWNGPFILALSPVVQALVAGNAVVLKPSEVAPRSGGLVGELFEAAGLPDGVLQVLDGDGETGAALANANVDKIAFTGSVATGRKVAVACAEQLIPCTLELGGNDAMIVCEDADPDVAAGGAVAGAFINTGQYCCGTERVYVVESVADAFVERVLARTAALRQGREGEFDVGAIFWPRQLEIVEEHVADAVALGARVRAGGRRHPDLDGIYYEPTVLTDVDQRMRIMQEETFGPVLPIVRVADVDEAVRLANDSRYGLGANVWTGNRHRGVEIARRLRSGSVCVNDMTMTFGVPEAPFGGLRDSGVGQVNGLAGARNFAHAFPVLVDRFGGRQTAAHYPYSARRDRAMQRLMRFLWGTALGRWLSG